MFFGSLYIHQVNHFFAFLDVNWSSLCKYGEFSHRGHNYVREYWVGVVK